MLARFLEWWRGPYTLHWGRYPQAPGRKPHVQHCYGYPDTGGASADAYRKGAHWYMVRDRRGREVWSSDHDLEAIRANPPKERL